jgi:hypothetical protein
MRYHAVTVTWLSGLAMTEWVPSPHMWSKIAQKNQFIFEEGDTNMLIEAYIILSLLTIR